MTVNETILESTIVDLREQLDVVSLKKQNLRTILQDAESIVMVNVPDPIEEDTRRTKKVLPKDSKLGAEITTERREAIYDKIIVDVAAL